MCILNIKSLNWKKMLNIYNKKLLIRDENIFTQSKLIAID